MTRVGHRRGSVASVAALEPRLASLAFPGGAGHAAGRQRAWARMEVRGGVSDYTGAASGGPAPGGVVVVGAARREPARVVRGCLESGLRPLRRLDIIAREGDKGPLFSVWTCARAADGEPCEVAGEQAIMRDARGERTEVRYEMRRFLGLG